MNRVIVLAHFDHREAHDLASRVCGWLRERVDQVTMPPADAQAVDCVDFASDVDPSTADLIVCLGGDGTMLRAVHLLNGAPVPVLGVNLGRLGYLTEVEPADAYTALERTLAGDFELDERMLVRADVTHGDGSTAGSWRALNEIVVEKLESGHTVHLRLAVDEVAFTSYAADGLIVATPTGSTAYSLSARGPVISPRHRALLVTPVAPHMLFDRSLVLDPNESVEITVSSERLASVAIDGIAVAELSEGAVVRCCADDATAGFVRLEDRRFHQVLKAKFGLTDR